MKITKLLKVLESLNVSQKSKDLALKILNNKLRRKMQSK